MSISDIREQIMLALDRMFDEACEADSEYGSYFAGYTGIYFDKTNGRLRLVREDGTEDKVTVTIDHGGAIVPLPIPDGKPPFPCPNCGSRRMSTVDDVLAFRAIHRFTTETADENIIGTLVTDATDDHSDGENTRLVCSKCGFNFQVPENVDIDWED